MSSRAAASATPGAATPGAAASGAAAPGVAASGVAASGVAVPGAAVGWSASWASAADEVETWHRDGRSVLGAVRWWVTPRVAVAAVLVLALVGGAVALRVAAAPSAPAVVLPEPSAAGAAPTATDPSDADAVVWVHVVGQVAAPGLVELPPGSRVADAVAAAGGALPDADLAVVNLAALVVDGAQVRVPAPGEPAVPADGTAAGTGPVSGAPPSGQGPGGQVDLNTATAAELEALPGIGPVLAERIVSWRGEHGAFADVDSLEDVPGIGPALLAGLRDQARV
ncbi:MAG: ComEA family DNA-binding protein [Micrococcales bacterium]|nr:ComEA family DNA-binding protein [Micrococcales bacterium]